MIFQLTLSVQLVITTFICYAYLKIAPYISISHQFFSGLDFCLPPSLQEIAQAEEFHKSKSLKKKKKNEEETGLEIRIVKVDENSLFDHVFWDSFDHLILIFLVVFFNFILTEFWSCVIEDQSSLNSLLLIFSILYCLYSLVCLLQYSPSKNKEYQIALGVFIASLVISFGVLDLMEGFFTFSRDLRKGHADFELYLEKHWRGKFEMSFSTFRIFLSLFASIVSTFICSPIRSVLSAMKELESTSSSFNYQVARFVYYLPFFLVWLWVDPIKSNAISQFSYFSSVLNLESYLTFRYYLVLLFCICHFFLIRELTQTVLGSAIGWASLIPNAVRNPSLQGIAGLIRFKILTIYSTIVYRATQMLAPNILLISLLFFYKMRGLLHVSLFPFCIPPATKEEVKSGNIPFSDEFNRGILSFSIWWVILMWTVFSMLQFKGRKESPSLSEASKTK